MSAYTKSAIALGDISVFALFVFIGESGHEIDYTGVLVRTLLPFVICWIIISPVFGAFKDSIFTNLQTTLWKIPLIWMLCGIAAIAIRTVVTDRPFMLSFTVVAIVVQGLLLTGWRILTNRMLLFL